MTFHDATQVTAVGDGRYAATIAEGWDIASNANGGYLLALVSRAIREPMLWPAMMVAGTAVSPPAAHAEVTAAHTQAAISSMLSGA